MEKSEFRPGDLVRLSDAGVAVGMHNPDREGTVERVMSHSAMDGNHLIDVMREGQDSLTRCNERFLARVVPSLF